MVNDIFFETTKEYCLKNLADYSQYIILFVTFLFITGHKFFSYAM